MRPCLSKNSNNKYILNNLLPSFLYFVYSRNILVILIIIIVKVNNTPSTFIIFNPLIDITLPIKNDNALNTINNKLINIIVILYILYLFTK